MSYTSDKLSYERSPPDLAYPEVCLEETASSVYSLGRKPILGNF